MKYYLKLIRFPKTQSGEIQWGMGKERTIAFNTVESARKYLMEKMEGKTYIEKNPPNCKAFSTPQGYTITGCILDRIRDGKYMYVLYEQIIQKTTSRGTIYYSVYTNQKGAEVDYKILPNGKLDSKNPEKNISDL